MHREWQIEERDGGTFAALRVTHPDGRMEQSPFAHATETAVRGWMADVGTAIAETLGQRDAAYLAANQHLDKLRAEEGNLRNLLDQLTAPAT